jgi:aminoglycoside phosphotransferase (APT) family kinase protein
MHCSAVICMLPDDVLALLHDTFPGAQIGEPTPTVGGFSNLVVACAINGMACVVKAATLPAKRADVRREAYLLARLAHSGLPTAQLVVFAERGAWTLAVTQQSAGLPGIRLYAQPPETLEPVYRALGSALRRVHEHSPATCLPAAGEQALPVPALPEAELDLAVRAAATRTALAALPLPAELHPALDAALAHPSWAATTPHLVHGDAGLHNVLWDGERVTLLDWEWAGWGSPLVDLAWLRWTMRFRALPPACWNALLAGYEPSATLDLRDDTLDTLALGQVAAILVRSHGRPGACEEWLRRAEWTVSLER